MALKVVVGEKNIPHLHNEFSHNQSIFSISPEVAVVKAVSFKVCSTGMGAGMLMEHGGSPAMTIYSESAKHIKPALNDLASIHKTGYQHGDARIANLIIFEGQYWWCDLQFAMHHSEDELMKRSFKSDIVTLMASLGKGSLVESSAFMIALDSYRPESTDSEGLIEFLEQDGKGTNAGRSPSTKTEMDDDDD